MTKIAFLCPVAESVSPTVFRETLALIAHSEKNGLEIGMIGVSERTLVDSARNMLSDQFLKGDCEWAFWMDADMVLPKDTLVHMLGVAKDKGAKLVTGVYYQRLNKHWPVLWVRSPELENGKKVEHENTAAFTANEYIGTFAMPGPAATEPFKVHSSGMGCALIHRNVFERMDYPWFKFIPGVCSEDFYFFVNAGKKGFELWADPVPVLGHEGDRQIITREDCYRNIEENKTGIQAIKI